MPDTDAAGCLSLEELEEFFAGTSIDNRAAKHVTTCASCAQRLEDLRQNNALMKSVIDANRGSSVDVGSISPATGPTGGVTVPGYDIQSEIHRGGQGVVYKAFHQATKRTVAVKVILQGALATSRQRHRFEREIEVVAALRHPGVVTVYDSGTTGDGRLFFAMEYVDGVSLDRYLLGDGRRLSPSNSNDGAAVTADGITPEAFHAPRATPEHTTLPVEKALGLFSQICEGVIHAHRRGVMHRDLKPSNIMVDQDGRAHVLDFGLAKVLDGNADRTLMTAPGEFMGTLAYAAPEQVKGDPNQIDIRTDVYALGIVLYEMLTGGRPFEAAESMSDVIKAITDTEPDPPSSKGPDLKRMGTGERRVGHEIDAIVLKALAKDPDRRYQSVEHFHKDIEHYLAGEPIDAKRDSKWYVFQKTVRRHRAAVAVIATFLLFAIGYGVTISVLYGRAVLAEQQAVREASRAGAINDFMVDMLESADPKGGSPSEMTIRELLDDIAARIETDLTDQPHVAAAVHSSVGNTYRNLALFEKAEVHLRASVEAARSSVGVKHADYANSISDLGLLLHDVGEFDESESLLRESVALIRALKGNDSTELATAQGNLAVLLYAKGDLAGAEVLFCATLAHDRLHLEPDDPDIVFSLYNLAALAAANEHFDHAIALYREALDLLQKLFGEDAHPLIGTMMRGMAISLESMEDFDAAEKMYRKSIAVSRKLLGEDHPDVAEGMSNLGTMLRTAKRNLPEAQQLLTDALAMRRKSIGADHPSVAVTLNDLARLKHVKGENKAAEEMHREAIAILGKTFPDDHWEIAYVESSLGETLTALGRFEKAEVLLIRSRAIIEAHRGATHATTARSGQRIVDLYVAWNLAEPGKGYDVKTVEWRAKLPKPDDADNGP